jgi:hypothetical protein
MPAKEIWRHNRIGLIVNAKRRRKRPSGRLKIVQLRSK